MTSSSASPELAAVSAYSRCCGGQLARQQQLRHADHAVERRADLVAHVGQELGLRARGLDRLGQRALALADVGAHRAGRVDRAVGGLERELDDVEHAPGRGLVALELGDLAGAQDLDVGDADAGRDVGREQLVVGAAEHVDADLAHRAPPLLVDQQVAAVAVLDRDRRGRVVQDPLQAVGLDAQVLLAGGERRGHRVEGRAELADLADAGGRHARVQVPVREALGGERDAPHRGDARSGAARARAARAARRRARRRRRTRTTMRVRRVCDVARRWAASCCCARLRPGELGPQRVEPPLALGRGGERRPVGSRRGRSARRSWRRSCGDRCRCG